MPNIVTGYVDTSRVSDEGKKKLMELFEGLEGWKDEHTYQYDFSTIFGVTNFINAETGEEDGPGYRQWNTDKMGTKWAYINDADEEGFQWEAAWDEPTDGIWWIYEQVLEVDPEAIFQLSAEDEFPNWISTKTFAKGEFVGDEYLEWSEMLRLMLDKYPELKAEFIQENYDSGEGDCWTQTGHDMFYEIQYEFMSDWFSEQHFFDLEYMHEHFEEDDQPTIH